MEDQSVNYGDTKEEERPGHNAGQNKDQEDVGAGQWLEPL